ncbi:MAG: hypothetical protein AB7I04_20010 [Pseudomonadales bacterium]
MPGSLRHLYNGALALLAMICAAGWFGNSGAGLMLLWWESRRASAAGAATPDAAWLEDLEADELVFAHVGSLRIVVVGARLGRRDVFRDELAEESWTRLRRRCFRPRDPSQPATGRSTSI